MATQSQSADVDVAVAGAGPAGRWLAALLVDRGLAVAVIDPDLDASWPNTYGVWADEVQNLELVVDKHRQWPAVSTWFGDRLRVVERRYLRVDNDGFQARLDAVIKKGAGLSIAARVSSIDHDTNGATLRCDNGQTLRTTLFVDATGRGHFLAFEDGAEPGFQTAYGIEARFDGDPLDGHSMVLMDYRWPPGAADDDPPTFLYGMSLGGDRYFVEETVLVDRPPLGREALEERLYRRLDARNVEVVDVLDEEWCKIPMGTALPVIGQPTIGFGAACGLVHPATGYQMARMLRAGPEVADTIADGLERQQRPDAIGGRAWQVLWPPSVRRARSLLTFGRDALLDMDRRQISRFFETFFNMPQAQWKAYLSGEAGHREVATTMLRFFAAAPMALRWSLGTQAVGDGASIWNAFAGSTSTPSPNPATRPKSTSSSVEHEYE